VVPVTVAMVSAVNRATAVKAEAAQGQTTINYEAVAIAAETVMVAAAETAAAVAVAEAMAVAVAVAVAAMAVAAMAAAMRQPWQRWRWCRLCLAEKSVIFNCTSYAWGDSAGFAGASDTQLASLLGREGSGCSGHAAVLSECLWLGSSWERGQQSWRWQACSCCQGSVVTMPTWRSCRGVDDGKEGWW